MSGFEIPEPLKILSTGVDIIILFSSALFGAFIKEISGQKGIFDTDKSKRPKNIIMSMPRMLVGSGISLIFTLVIRAEILNSKDFVITLAVAIILGMTGFEIFTRLSSIEGIKNLARDINDVGRYLTRFNSLKDKKIDNDVIVIDDQEESPPEIKKYTISPDDTVITKEEDDDNDDIVIKVKRD